jgi:hypothetical protein
MNDRIDLERLVNERFAREHDVRPPERAVDQILTQARRTRPLPRWLAFIKEPSMRYSSSLAVGSPTVRVLTLLLATLLLATLVAAAGAGASRLLAAEEDDTVADLEPSVFVYQVVGGSDAGFSIEASDPRATGFLAVPFHDHQLDTGGQGYALGLSADEATLTTDDGTWSGTAESIEAKKFLAPQVDRGIWIAKLNGEDALEGLSMSLYSIGVGGDEHPELWGYIYPRDALTPTE